MMIDNNDYEKVYDNVVNRFSKGSRLENERTFRGTFTKYMIASRKFVENKNVKFVNQLGGIPLGQVNNGEEIIVDSSDAHTLIIGSTGSKKSRLVVMPTIHILGVAGESMIVSDPKAEIYGRTAHFLLREGYKIEVINLRNPSYGNAWNPLSIPYSFYKNEDIDKACEFVNDISTNLMLSEKSSKDPYWDYSAGDLFFGLTLLLFKYCKLMEVNEEYVNIGNLLKLRKHIFRLQNLRSSLFWELIEDDDIISSSLLGTIEAPDKTQACILSTFDEKMRCFMIQPSLLEMLSNNSVSMDCVNEKKTIIYLIMPDEKTSYHKLITLFIKQSYEYLIYKAQVNIDGKMKIRVNYILDEFSSLPTIKDFPAMITAARSRNIRFNLVIQSKHQLLERYKEETETIQSNCNNWIFFTSREIKLLEELSMLCGKRADGEKYVIPLASLQHFNKNRGEALVLSGRLYPFISTLADIDKYDNGKYLFLEFEKEKRNKHTLLDFNAKNQFDIEQIRVIKNEQTDEKDEYDIQRELEAKFDELFGLLEDPDGEE